MKRPKTQELSKSATENRRSIGLEDHIRLLSHTAKMQIEGDEKLKNGIGLKEYEKLTESRV